MQPANIRDQQLHLHLMAPHWSKTFSRHLLLKISHHLVGAKGLELVSLSAKSTVLTPRLRTFPKLN